VPDGTHIFARPSDVKGSDDRNRSHDDRENEQASGHQADCWRTASPAIACRETLCPKDPDLPAGAELQAMAQIGRAFKEKFFAPGLSVAIVRDSTFVTVTTFPFEQRRVGL
jgi:hypothetical protein